MASVEELQELVRELREEVAELKKERQTISDQLEYERSEFVAALNDRQENIQTLQLRNQRLEHACKEALILLEKPLEKAEASAMFTGSSTLPRNSFLNPSDNRRLSFFGGSGGTGLFAKKASEANLDLGGLDAGAGSGGTAGAGALGSEEVRDIRMATTYLKNVLVLGSNEQLAAGSFNSLPRRFTASLKMAQEGSLARNGNHPRSSTNISALHRLATQLSATSAAPSNHSGSESRDLIPEPISLEPFDLSSSGASSNLAGGSSSSGSFSVQMTSSGHVRRSSSPGLSAKQAELLQLIVSPPNSQSASSAENSPTKAAAAALPIVIEGAVSDSSLALGESESSIPDAIPVPLSARGDGGGAFEECLRCQQLLEKQEELIEMRTFLKRDLEAIGQKYEQEVEMRMAAEECKGILENEIEELTATLFQQANKMVEDEARLRHELEVANKALSGKLRETLEAFSTRENELSQLKVKLAALDGAKQRSTARAPTIRRAGRTDGTHQELGRKASNLNGGSVESIMDPTASIQALHTGSTPNDGSLGPSSPMVLSGGVGGGALPLPAQPVVSIRNTAVTDSSWSLHYRPNTEAHFLSHVGSKTTEASIVFVDGFLLKEFQEHLTMFVAGENRDFNFSSSGMLSPFLRKVYAEDVEPCLTVPPVQGNTQTGIFGSSRRSSTSGQKFSKKKLLDAIFAARCLVLPAPPSVGAPVEKGPEKRAKRGSTIPGAGANGEGCGRCFMCGTLRECEFRLKMGDAVAGPETDAFGEPLDRFCRDRIIAVNEFYGFLCQVRQGTIAGNLMELYRCAVKLRRNMAAARIGSVTISNENFNEIQVV